MERLEEACASQKFTFNLELNEQRIVIRPNVVSESETDAKAFALGCDCEYLSMPTKCTNSRHL